MCSFSNTWPFLVKLFALFSMQALFAHATNTSEMGVLCGTVACDVSELLLNGPVLTVSHRQTLGKVNFDRSRLPMRVCDMFNDVQIS